MVLGGWGGGKVLIGSACYADGMTFIMGKISGVGLLLEECVNDLVCVLMSQTIPAFRGAGLTGFSRTK